MVASADPANGLRAFQWTPQPAAEKLVHDLLGPILIRSPFADTLSRRMLSETGTRLFDWVDSIHLPPSAELAGRLRESGFHQKPADAAVWSHPGGVFPRIVLSSASSVWLKVESVADFCVTHQLCTPIEGTPGAAMRRAWISDDHAMAAVERHGWHGNHLPPADPHADARAAILAEQFQLRRRRFETRDEAFAHVLHLIEAATAEIGVDRTCSLFFAAERAFWQRRNRAAQVQKARQDTLGLGWANHDHHTYRSSRPCFNQLIAVFEKLGCVCRERFYAGREAGWGAQVLEQPGAGIVIFADVDLAPDEVEIDFAHRPLADRAQLGTVGLWCALHGEALLEAGMHHLECQFDFASLKQQLESAHGIRVMAPFTNLPYLRQAFTEGERWPVDGTRIDALLARGAITPAQAEEFRRHGAIGSHLENLQRDEGYKGFNQKGVSEIIAATDPRLHAAR